MKNFSNIITLCSVMVLCVASCNNGENLVAEDSEPERTVYAVKAFIDDGGTVSRATVNSADGKSFMWQADDSFDMYLDGSASANKFTIINGTISENAKSADFSCDNFQIPETSANYVAFYPADGFANTSSSYTFMMPDDVSTQTDNGTTDHLKSGLAMVATGELNAEDTNIHFGHKTSLMRFGVTNTSSKEYYTIESIKLVSTVDCFGKEYTYSADNEEYTSLQKEIVLNIVNGVELPPNISLKAYTLAMRGEDIIDDADFYIEATLKGGGTIVRSQTFKGREINAGVNKPDALNGNYWLPGYYYSFLLDLKEDRLEFESVTCGAWNKETLGDNDVVDAKLSSEIASEVSSLSGYSVEGIESNGLITDSEEGFKISYTENGYAGLTWEGTCEVERVETGNMQTYTFSQIKSDIKVTYLPNIEVGYYFYDNGTWGTEPEKDGCETLGVVFKVEKDANDQSDYNMLSKVRGYVVCTTYTDATQRKWVDGQTDSEYVERLKKIEISSNDDERESDFSGYKRTMDINQALSDLESTWESKAPFWYAFKNVGIKAPENTSGWYIPTVAQLKAIQESCNSLSGKYLSSQLYVGENTSGGANGITIDDSKKTTIWAMRYYVEGNAIEYGWSIDTAKLLIVLTF